MANRSGAKWNKGGAKRRNRLSIDGSCFAELAETLDRLGGDLKAVTNDALQQAGETVAADTLAAIDNGNLPRGGKYSTGDTERSAIKESDVRVDWSGNIATIGLGFDKSKAGAGGFLITGTPRMRPDYALQAMYNRKTYQRKIVEDIQEIFNDAIDDLM